MLALRNALWAFVCQCVPFRWFALRMTQVQDHVQQELEQVSVVFHSERAEHPLRRKLSENLNSRAPNLFAGLVFEYAV